MTTLIQARELGQIKGLGEINWTRQTNERLTAAGLSIGVGALLGVGINLIQKPKGMTRMATWLSVLGSMIALGSSLVPVEGSFFTHLSTVSGGLTGYHAVTAMMSK